MTILLRGRAVATAMRHEISASITQYKLANVHPRLVTLLYEGDAASTYYAHSKAQVAEELGVAYEIVTVPTNTKSHHLLDLISHYNLCSDVHGILVELPLPPSLNMHEVVNAISPEKDVDGLHDVNRIALLAGKPGIRPATPQACVKILEHYGYEIGGKRVTLVGRGMTVGMPLLHLLLQMQATVTVCHSQTADVARHVKGSEYVFVAVGREGIVTKEMFSAGTVVVDAGMHETPEGQIVGDVSADIYDCLEAVTPTPGGIGTVTTMQLFANLMQCIALQIDMKKRDGISSEMV